METTQRLVGLPGWREGLEAAAGEDATTPRATLLHAPQTTLTSAQLLHAPTITAVRATAARRAAHAAAAAPR